MTTLHALTILLALTVGFTTAAWLCWRQDLNDTYAEVERLKAATDALRRLEENHR